MFTAHRLQIAMLAVLTAALPAAGQVAVAPQPQTTPPAPVRTVPPGNEWSHGTTLNVFGGAAVTTRDRAAAGGGAMGWEIKPWFALEGSGGWLDWGHDAHAFTATMTARAALLTRRPAVPFLAGGVGVYHASFDRFTSSIPQFYRRRMGAMPDQPRHMMTFTDPSLVAGGGMEVFVSRHWTIRPEVMAHIVLRDARGFIATTGVVRLGYHFEDHPVTPSAH
jgi:hypothetical protein